MKHSTRTTEKRTSTGVPKKSHDIRRKKLMEAYMINDFGLTNDIMEAGYILDDGKMLDFGSSHVDPINNPRRDHSEVYIPRELEIRHEGGGVIPHVLQFSLTTNAIRVFAMVTKSGNIDITFALNVNTRLTTKQKTVLINNVKSFTDKGKQVNVAYDIVDKHGHVLDSHYLTDTNEEELKIVFKNHELKKRGTKND